MMDKLGPHWLIVGLCDITEELPFYWYSIHLPKNTFVKEDYNVYNTVEPLSRWSWMVLVFIKVFVNCIKIHELKFLFKMM